MLPIDAHGGDFFFSLPLQRFATAHFFSFFLVPTFNLDPVLTAFFSFSLHFMEQDLRLFSSFLPH